MIFKILLFILPLAALAGEDILVVRLETEKQLLPLYAGRFVADNAGLESAYLDKLEQILRFDLGHNGATKLSSEEQKVFYVVKARVHDKKLEVQLFTLSSGAAKAVDPISLTGDLAQDRRKMHNLADTIHKELFGKNGIASTRFLYTVKNSKKWLSEVWEADYDGANARCLTEGAGYAVTPTYIPATPGFLYVSYLNGQPKIFIGSLENGSYRRLTLMRGNQLMPAISRQRDKIAFINDITGNPDLFIQPFSIEKGAIGKPQQIFAAHKATQGTPTFSPDGNQIAFVSNKDGAPRIYVIDIPAPGTSLNNIKAKLITKQNRENTAPAWSPDGTKLAYCSMTSGVRQIWIYDFEKRQERQITEGAGHKENPTWATNSLHLIYNSTGPSGSELYLINLNQPQAYKISSGAGEKHFPNWTH